MERTQVLVIAVVVAALALFGLRFFSDDPIDAELASGGSRLGDVASAPRFGADDGERGLGGAGSNGGVGRPGGRLRQDSKGGDAPRAGEFGRRGSDTGSGAGSSGSARVLSGGGLREGSSVGVSGSGPGGRGGEGTATLSGESGGRLGPRAALKDDLVEKLGARQPLPNEIPPAEGDAALTVTKPDDIPDQAGEAEDVKEPEEGGDGIKITDRGRVEFPNAGNASSNGTISFQIKPDWAGADQTDNALVQIRQEHQWNNRLELVKNGEFLRFIVTPDTGQEIDISSRISNWNPNEVHDIQVSWGEGRTTLYIDGEVAGSRTYEGELNFSAGTPMFLGADWRGSNYNGANATLYDFTLNNDPSHP